MDVMMLMSLLLVYFMGAGLCDALQRTSLLFKMHKAHYHPGPVIRSFQGTRDIPYCMKKCTKDLACVSFNLNKTSHGLQCNLQGEIQQEGELIPDQTTDFYGEENL